jgi:pimeloyl-ACP methyl ester carboxylesterase
MNALKQRFTLLGLGLAIVASVAGCKPSPKIETFDQLDYGMPVEKADVNGTQLAYVDIGDGPQTLVLIHGLGSYIPAWKKNIPELSKNYRVIAIDLPGYGRSDKPNAPYSMRYFVSKIHGLLGQLGVSQPVLVGHSMGGQIAMTYALMHPNEVHALVLSSPAGLETFRDGEAKWLANAVTPEFTCYASDEAVYTRHAGNFHAMTSEAEFMVEDRIAMKGATEFEDYCTAVSRSVAGMLDDPVHDRLPNIDEPTLVLFGKNDALIPNPFLHGGSTKRLAEREVKRIDGAKLIILPKAGHFAQFEQADAWNGHVLDFVRALPEPAATPAAAAEPPAEAKPAKAAKPEPAPTPEPTVAAEPAAEPAETPADPPATVTAEDAPTSAE